jgi:hypothetical protein
MGGRVQLRRSVRLQADPRKTAMTRLRSVLAVLLVTMLLPGAASADGGDTAGAWRSLASRLEAGTQVNVELRSGQRFHAVLVRSDAEALVLLPKTRIAVPVQAVRYEEIASLERREGGVGAGKAVAIGVAAGAAAFLGMLLIALGTIG